jgi:NADH-quinone oxidoreductase subunit J
MVELIVFVVAGGACLAGAIGVVTSRNPVHSALSLVATLFGIAVLFVAQEANFLAAVQVIVYAGAIVVLFLFVIMLLGVDEADDLDVEPLKGQRAAATFLGVALFALPVAALASTDFEATGALGDLDRKVPDINQLGEALFTDYLYAFEITSVLLVIAVVGAVLLSRRGARRTEEILDPGQADHEEAIAERMAEATRQAHPELGNGAGPRPMPTRSAADAREVRS